MRSFSGLSTKAFFLWPASASTMLQRPRRVAGQKKVLTGFLQKPRGVYRYPVSSRVVGKPYLGITSGLPVNRPQCLESGLQAIYIAVSVCNGGSLQFGNTRERKPVPSNRLLSTPRWVVTSTVAGCRTLFRIKPCCPATPHSATKWDLRR